MADKVVIVRGADWQGLYVDGKLKLEDHTLRVKDVLEALHVKFRERDVDQEWLEEEGRLPDDLKDVIF